MNLRVELCIGDVASSALMKESGLFRGTEVGETFIIVGHLKEIHKGEGGLGREGMSWSPALRPPLPPSSIPLP